MNNRKNERHQVLESGTILFQGSKIDCAVHDISVGGAKLEIDADIAEALLAIALQSALHQMPDVRWRVAGQGVDIGI